VCEDCCCLLDPVNCATQGQAAHKNLQQQHHQTQDQLPIAFEPTPDISPPFEPTPNISPPFEPTPSISSAPTAMAQASHVFSRPGLYCCMPECFQACASLVIATCATPAPPPVQLHPERLQPTVAAAVKQSLSPPPSPLCLPPFPPFPPSPLAPSLAPSPPYPPPHPVAPPPRGQCAHLECLEPAVAAVLQWPLNAAPPVAFVAEGGQAQEHHDAKHIRQPASGQHAMIDNAQHNRYCYCMSGRAWVRCWWWWEGGC
jgi:hypothetical protein